MTGRINIQGRWINLAGAAALALQVGIGTDAFGQAKEAVTPPKVMASNTVNAGSIPIYTVADCVRIAYERQPALTAARHGVAAKQAAANGLSRRNFNYLFAPDIDVRRKQSCKGVSAAQAELMQAEVDTHYAVTRTYYTAIYARLQYDVAADILTKLQFDREDLDRALKAGAPKLSAPMLDRLDIAINLAKAKQLEAEEGMNRALAALREAMGIGLECSSFQLADLSLPDPTVTPDRCDIVNLALARRGELMQVLIAADVFRLEVDAQGRIFRFKTVGRTFASAGDIHSQPVPPGLRNGDYRPGAIGFEMPVTLAGPRDSRVEQACQYSGRADAVVAKTKELIALEAEDGFAKWNEATRKCAFTKDAVNKAKKYIKQLEEDRKEGATILPEDMTMSRLLAVQANVALNEAMFQQVLALANLERITAGGFSAGFSPTQP